ncbi:hypothetical protein, partial [Diaphorobacter nitroreducens]|uniref:hypothetical protein n=1 Tax=Diaphorobacter nitroreducens TaxID=164759 RepID=UPI0028992642
GQSAVVSHYPLQLPQALEDAGAGRGPAPDRDGTDRPLPLLNYHGHLHRDQWPPTARIQHVNVGWDVTQGMVCL